MSRALVAAALAAVAGCADGRSVVSLTITADTPVTSVDHVHVVVVDPTGRMATPPDVSVAGGTIPPALTATYALPKTEKGNITFMVTALDAMGATVGSGQTVVPVAPSQTSSGTVSLTAAAPLHRKLVFQMVQSPQKVFTTIAPAVQVSIVDDNGNVLTDATDPVTLALSGGAPNAFLAGHITANAVAGVAAFGDLDIDLAGNGYTLTAMAPNADSASATFDVVAGVWVPSSIGLDSGTVRTLCFDPKNPMVVWALGQLGSGLWHSSDRGATWDERDAALPSFNPSSCAVSGQTAGLVFVGAGGKLYRSDDDGHSWRMVGAGLPGGIVVIDPSDDKTLYAWSSAGLYKSTDGGENFTTLSTMWFTKFALATSAPTTLYADVGTNSTTVTIQKSTDGGAHWAPINTGLTDPLFGALAVAPSDANTAYVVTSAPGAATATLHRTSNGGTSWTTAATGSFFSLAVDPADPMTVYSLGETSTGFVVQRSAQGGASPTAMTGFPPKGSSETTPVLLVDPTGIPWLVMPYSSAYVAADKSMFTLASSGIATVTLSIAATANFNSFYATDWSGRIYRSANSAASWSDVTTSTLDLTSLGQDVVVAGGVHVYLLDFNGVLYHAADSATPTWAVVDSTIPNGIFAYDCDRAMGTTLLAVDNSYGVWRSTNAGAAWTATGATIPKPSTNGAVTVYQDSMNTMIAYVATPGTLYKTINAGAAFTDISPTTHPTASAFAIDPTNDMTLYLSTTTNQLLKSTNGGTSWTTVGQGLPTSGNSAPTQLVIDPATPSTVYALGNDAIIYKSKDGGATFTALTSPRVVWSLAVDPNLNSMLLAATSLGVWKSTTGGE